MDKDETVFRIKSLKKFKCYLREKIKENFDEKIIFDVVNESSFLCKEMLKEEIPTAIFEYEIENFVVKDEGDFFIIRKDIMKLITSLTNETISMHLNKMVDMDIVEMCWDSDRDEFIWAPKKDNN